MRYADLQKKSQVDNNHCTNDDKEFSLLEKYIIGYLKTTSKTLDTP